jgi:1-acyl-sn-glycerol-3-phosphate acyltransferase
MLYRILKWLFYLTVKGYFRSIYVKGKSNIPGSDPIIFVANHNSAFMDPILLGVHLSRPVHFLARGESFRSEFSSRIFGLLNMIPIYRPEISPDEVHKNPKVFERCFRHLQKEKIILIFPEGISKTVRGLRKLKTGAARIASGAESINDFKLNVSIVPVGINYSNPHYFRSDVFINFGSPIKVSEYRDDYLKNERDTVIKLTENIRTHLEKLLVIVKEEKLNKLIKRIEKLYRSTLRDRSSPQELVLQDFYSSREIAKAVDLFYEFQPEKVLNFEIKIDNYIKKLNQLNIRDTHIKKLNIPFQLFKNFMYFTLGSPVFLYGYVVNFLPYYTALLISRSITVRQDFIGSMKLALGMFVFLLFYSIQILIIGSLTNWYWTILFAFSLYPAGLFTINYLKNYHLLKGNLRFLSLFNNRGEIIEKLKMTRQELIDELEAGRRLYQKNIPGG